jgi:ATP-dependent RNA helicase SUPV3L1/SUV3
LFSGSRKEKTRHSLAGGNKIQTIQQSSNGDKREFQSLDDVKPGDCLVAFSYTDIFNTKEMLEKVMRKKKARQEPGVVEEVLPVFGAMPPEVKADIIKKFNENPERSCIVATDAIGMGMNLNINRIIFTNV